MVRLPEPEPSVPDEEKGGLRRLTPLQWRSGIAAWLGWAFDGLEMHLYTLVAAVFVAQLMRITSPSDPLVKERSAWIQAAFLVGWALGGGLFGRLGDLLGRSRALSMTVLTYACFTGLSAVSQTWWHLMIFRFLAALGIGGEWAVGSSLLAETWPRRWRPWIAAVLQSGVNIGILVACLAYYFYVRIEDQNPRYLFLVGVLPAFLVFWIRRAVPETEEWQQAKAASRAGVPGIRSLFQGEVRRTTWLTIAVCATSLTAWWAFVFWNPQHLRNLPDLADWTARDREQFVSKAFFLVIGTSILGNFFAGWLARRLGYRRALALMFGAFAVVMTWTYAVPRTYESLLRWIPWVGFCSGCFGLFTMYLPPLFPTLLRTTGAGFCYNIGRIVAAGGTVVFGLFSVVGDFRYALLYDGWLFIPAALLAWCMPEVQDDDEPPPRPG